MCPPIMLWNKRERKHQEWCPVNRPPRAARRMWHVSRPPAPHPRGRRFCLSVIVLCGCVVSALLPGSGCRHWGGGGPLAVGWRLLLSITGSRAQPQRLGSAGLVALWPVGSSQTRDGTCVSYTGRRTLCHWAPREAPPPSAGATSQVLGVQTGVLAQLMLVIAVVTRP